MRNSDISAENRRRLLEALAWRIYCDTVGCDPKSGSFSQIPSFMKQGMLEKAIEEARLI